MPHPPKRPPPRLFSPAARSFRTQAFLALVWLSMPPASEAGDVHLAAYSGPITPVAAEFLVSAVEAAAAAGAEAVVIVLDTPGGLDSSMREIVKAELAASVPVVVYVGPAGGRAASAGAFITIAAHVAAMAPGTNIGSASPVQMMGAAMDSTMKHKVTNDAAAYIAAIATQKGRDPETARAFVTTALNLTASEARERGVIEVIAPTVAALLDSLQGRTLVVDGSARTLETGNAALVEHVMSLRQKFLRILVDPNVAYLLMMLGIYGIFFELSNPGSILPGILGGISVLLALFAFQALPVDYSGVGLVLLGVILFILEVKVPSYGVLTIGGLASLVLGSLMLFDSPDRWAQVSLKVLVPSVAVFAGFFLMCVTLAVRGQKRPVVTGKEALVGARGRVVAAIDGGRRPGKIVVHGEVWDAVAAAPVPIDGRVRVVRVRGRLLDVEELAPLPASEVRQPDSPTRS